MGLSNINPSKFSNRRIDIMYTSPEEYPFAVLYFTGSAEFNVKMRIPQVGWNSVHVLKSNNLLDKKDLSKTLNDLSMASPFSLEEKQILLECLDVNIRKEKMELILNNYIKDEFENKTLQ